jgi:hypothetical protein
MQTREGNHEFAVAIYFKLLRGCFQNLVPLFAIPRRFDTLVAVRLKKHTHACARLSGGTVFRQP